VEEGEYFAIALDADDRRVDSLTSNNGHLLWSGIVRLELLDIPGRWGRVDAFARGRVDTSPPDPYH